MIFWALRIENRARLTHFWPKKIPLLANIYMWIVWMTFSSASAYSRIIRINRIFRIRMANPSLNSSKFSEKNQGRQGRPHEKLRREGSLQINPATQSLCYLCHHIIYRKHTICIQQLVRVVELIPTDLSDKDCKSNDQCLKP